jgi:hypothetical protein
VITASWPRDYPHPGLESVKASTLPGRYVFAEMVRGSALGDPVWRMTSST